MELIKPTPRELLLNLIARKQAVIYGARATNFHTNERLRKETIDYDILTKKPKKTAEELKDILNKYYPNKYEVLPALHKKTFKVKDKETGENFADFTGTTKKPRSYNELGVRYAHLDYSERKLLKAIRNPEASFRHEKDKDTLRRIREQKKSIW